MGRLGVHRRGITPVWWSPRRTTHRLHTATWTRLRPSAGRRHRACSRRHLVVAACHTRRSRSAVRVRWVRRRYRTAPWCTTTAPTALPLCTPAPWRYIPTAPTPPVRGWSMPRCTRAPRVSHLREVTPSRPHTCRRYSSTPRNRTAPTRTRATFSTRVSTAVATPMSRHRSVRCNRHCRDTLRWYTTRWRHCTIATRRHRPSTASLVQTPARPHSPVDMVRLACLTITWPRHRTPLTSGQANRPTQTVGQTASPALQPHHTPFSGQPARTQNSGTRRSSIYSASASQFTTSERNSLCSGDRIQFFLSEWMNGCRRVNFWHMNMFQLLWMNIQ